MPSSLEIPPCLSPFGARAFGYRWCGGGGGVSFHEPRPEAGLRHRVGFGLRFRVSDGGLRRRELIADGAAAADRAAATRSAIGVVAAAAAILTAAAAT